MFFIKILAIFQTTDSSETTAKVHDNNESILANNLLPNSGFINDEDNSFFENDSLLNNNNNEANHDAEINPQRDSFYYRAFSPNQPGYQNNFIPFMGRAPFNPPVNSFINNFGQSSSNMPMPLASGNGNGGYSLANYGNYGNGNFFPPPNGNSGIPNGNEITSTGGNSGQQQQLGGNYLVGSQNRFCIPCPPSNIYPSSNFGGGSSTPQNSLISNNNYRRFLPYGILSPPYNNFLSNQGNNGYIMTPPLPPSNYQQNPVQFFG